MLSDFRVRNAERVLSRTTFDLIFVHAPCFEIRILLCLRVFVTQHSLRDLRGISMFISLKPCQNDFAHAIVHVIFFVLQAVLIHDGRESRIHFDRENTGRGVNDVPCAAFHSQAIIHAQHCNAICRMRLSLIEGHALLLE